MSWADSHRLSEGFAVEAALALRDGDVELARQRYARAAEHEVAALAELDQAKVRTWAITAVSAVSLWFKAKDFREAEKLAFAVLSDDDLPRFASEELEMLLQAIWTERTSKQAGVAFLPGQVMVSIDGGDVAPGAAPLDLVVSKVQTIQALFYRTIEFVRGMPHRLSGNPLREIQDACRPWLLQAPPGSYQFSVAIQEPAQADFFKDPIQPLQVARQFLEVLRASASDDVRGLEKLVPDMSYRSSFMKLTRNLSPTGKTFERMEIRSVAEPNGVLLLPESRTQINRALRSVRPEMQEGKEVSFAGILRAVHLDKDWLDIAVDGKSIHVVGLKEAIDDVIGPMVNRPVVVRAIERRRAVLEFVDIEVDD